MRSARWFSLFALATLAGCKDAAGTTPPQTLDEASKAFDEAIVRVGWAQQDLWRLGGRDIVVSVQLDSALAPQYFRLPRRAR